MDGSIHYPYLKLYCLPGRCLVIGIACRSDFDFHFVGAFLQAFLNSDFPGLRINTDFFPEVLPAFLRRDEFIRKPALCPAYSQGLRYCEFPRLVLQLLILDPDFLCLCFYSDRIIGLIDRIYRVCRSDLPACSFDRYSIFPCVSG